VIVYAVLAVAWEALHLAVEWKTFFGAEGAMTLLAIGVLGIARAHFRRERFFAS
jgi:hypothetical protein